MLFIKPQMKFGFEPKISAHLQHSLCFWTCVNIVFDEQRWLILRIYCTNTYWKLRFLQTVKIFISHHLRWLMFALSYKTRIESKICCWFYRRISLHDTNTVQYRMLKLNKTSLVQQIKKSQIKVRNWCENMCVSHFFLYVFHQYIYFSTCKFVVTFDYELLTLEVPEILHYLEVPNGVKLTPDIIDVSSNL